MADKEYVDFDISIERLDAEGGQYRARVLNAPAGSGSHPFFLPFEVHERENYILRLGAARRGRRRIETMEVQLAKEFGGRLFDAVFGGEVLTSWRSSLDLSARNNQGLRLKLRLSDAPDLINLPWEYLYSASDNSFPALSVDTPIVRFLELSGWTPPLLVQPPIKVLVMISSPVGVAELDTEAEWQGIEAAFAKLSLQGSVQVERVDPTLPALLRILDENEYHIFHFIGHGAYDPSVEDGILLLEDENGQARSVSGQQLGTLLRDEDSIRLVVLNACDGGRTADDDPFAGVGQSLLQQGIPAVVAMQFEISDRAALVFAQEFYSALAHGYAVDSALSRTRKGMYAIGESAEWGTPVLYMRVGEGKLFDIDTSTLPSMKDADPPVIDSPSQELLTDRKVSPYLTRRNIVLAISFLVLIGLSFGVYAAIQFFRTPRIFKTQPSVIIETVVPTPTPTVGATPTVSASSLNDSNITNTQNITPTSSPQSEYATWFGDVPKNVIAIAGSDANADWAGYEIRRDELLYGSFSFYFTEALVDPESDYDANGEISFEETVLSTWNRLLRAGEAQNPVIVGTQKDLGLFCSTVESCDGVGGLNSSERDDLHILLVGINQYEHINDLRGPLNDIARLDTLLTENHSRMLFDLTTSTVITDQLATAGNIRSELEKLVANKGENSVILFYFSGTVGKQVNPITGITEKVVAAYDSDYNGVLIPVPEIVSLLGKSEAKYAIIIIDG